MAFNLFVSAMAIAALFVEHVTGYELVYTSFEAAAGVLFVLPVAISSPVRRFLEFQRK